VELEDAYATNNIFVVFVNLTHCCRSCNCQTDQLIGDKRIGILRKVSPYKHS